MCLFIFAVIEESYPTIIKMNMTDIDNYMADFPEEVQKRMKLIRETIHNIIPEIKEKISWSMPTFYLKKNIAHFAGYKNHIGFYPGVEAIEIFKEELSPYKTSKGTIQFPHNKPLPIHLIEKIIRENLKLLTP